VVRGLALADGRRVLVKAHQPREPRERLEAVARVQAHLHGEGFPCPRPLAGPAPLGAGLGVAEEWLDAGEPRDTHDPGCRRAMAAALAGHLELTRPCGRPPGLARGWSLYVPGSLWPPEAHSPLFDFAATAAGAEWIDALAAQAKRLAAGGEPLAGHHDWCGEHMRFAGGAVVAAYDWDSLAIGSEAVIAGNAAATFTADFTRPGHAQAPEPDEARAFVDEYSAARATPLTRAERSRIAAAATFVLAYGARCEHALGVEGPVTAALRAHGEAYLVP
jgi:hypothetical protein